MPIQEHRYDVVWPRSERQMENRPAAPRLDSLRGKTIVQLWDYLFRGDEVFSLLEEGLRARYPDIRFVSWSEFGSTHGEDEREILANLPGRLREFGADAVVSGMGC